VKAAEAKNSQIVKADTVAASTTASAAQHANVCSAVGGRHPLGGPGGASRTAALRSHGEQHGGGGGRGGGGIACDGISAPEYRPMTHKKSPAGYAGL